MKIEFKTALAFLAIATMTVVGCNPYDDSVLSGRVDDLENRVKTLEERIEEFQTSVDDFSILINQYKAETRIESFTEVADGYLITFADNKGTMHIKHGGIPELSVVFDSELQEYVWTANGNVITDKEGKPVPAYIAPQFEVRNGKLGYTLGNEWHEVTNGETVGLIADVVETKEGVNFILSSGSIITIPKVGFRLNIDFFEYGAPAGKTVVIPYSVTDADSNAEILVYPDEGFTVVNEGAELYVTLPAEEDKAYSGKVLVVAVNGNGATSAKVIRFGALVTEVTSAEVIKVSRKGGFVAINIKSNRPYTCGFDMDQLPPDWLFPSAGPLTKAAREDVVYYEAAPMPEDMHEDRQASVFVEWQTNIREEQEDWDNYENYIVKKEIVIIQLDTKEIAVGAPMDNSGSPYQIDYINTLLEGQLEGGWTFKNCVVVSHGEFIQGGGYTERRLALNCLLSMPDGVERRGSLTSPVLQDGVGILYIQYGSIVARTNTRQHIKFKVQCLSEDGQTVLFEKEITQATSLQVETKIYEETFEINQNVPCRIVITNTSTKKGGDGDTNLTFNTMKFHSAYYTSYKAE